MELSLNLQTQETLLAIHDHMDVPSNVSWRFPCSHAMRETRNKRILRSREHFSTARPRWLVISSLLRLYSRELSPVTKVHDSVELAWLAGLTVQCCCLVMISYYAIPDYDMF